jgi:hypothetical protein
VSRPHYSARLMVCSKDRHWVARSSIDLLRPCQGHTGLRGRRGARLTRCDRVEATLLGSFDGLFEGPALGCEEGLELDRLGATVSRPHYSSDPLIVCWKDRHWVATTAWSSIDLVRFGGQCQQRPWRMRHRLSNDDNVLCGPSCFVA